MDTFYKPTQEELQKDLEIFNKIKFGKTAPSPEDNRDFIACLTAAEEFPEEFLAPQTEIFDQGAVGSCVAHSCATAMAQGEENILQKHNEYSRGYIYGNRRPTDAQGEGMIIREALKQLNKCGDVLYQDFPYNKTYKTVKKLIEENQKALAEKALPHAIIDYFRCYNETQIKRTIMQNGGVIICVPVYSDFGRDLHKPKTDQFDGYHAMIIVGWTKDNKWVVQNSWGNYWGYNGKLLMDFDYPVSEYWGITVKTTTDDTPERKTIFDDVLNFFIDIALWWKNFFKRIFHK